MKVAASITVGLLALFAIETVSLHALDAVFFRTIGSVFAIGWLWAIAAAGMHDARSLPRAGMWRAPWPSRMTLASTVRRQMVDWTLARQVARFAYLHGSSSANEFLQKWEKTLQNPGGEHR